MSKANWGNRTCAVFLLMLATAIALPAQTFTTLHSFAGPPEGAVPTGGLVQATDGNFYGTTNEGGTNGSNGCGGIGCGTVFKITPTGALTTLHSFDQMDGQGGPFAGLVQATDKNFYGTTLNGGEGFGTVFKITPDGTLTTLHEFAGTDGEEPFAGLVQAADGNLYGATVGGETFADNGTVFKITPTGALTTLHLFAGYPTEGRRPSAGLIQATDGNLYGTTSDGGGGNGCGASGCGTVFKITPGGMLTTVYSFCSQSGCPDGNSPLAGLVQATDGNFYGTTSGGHVVPGTVFKITPSGTLTTLYSFCSQSGCSDGFEPHAGLIQATDGNFYGTTNSGGANPNGCGGSGCGTVFKITPSGTLTTLYSFCSQSGCSDGYHPRAGLIQATDGNFYGTTILGGDESCGFRGNGCGTVFKFVPAPMAQSAFSRKTHGAAGTFDVPLPLTGNVGIECRSGGVTNDYQMIINFMTTVTVGSASVTSGTGSVSSFSVSGSQVTVNLTGVTNVQGITVTLFNVNDGTHMGNVPVSMGVLVGDVNGNAVVNATDVALTKSQVGQAVSSSNFREDVNANGTISSTDVAIVKSDVGTSLPP
jgi:uncharacterized repeat protein (TIGR03803 family)